MRDKNLRIMLETSLLVGAALLLSMLKFWRMPYGGSVSLEMIPIFILAFRRGGKMGILGGALLGFLKLLLSPYIIHPVQLLLDYPVPYAVLGVAGFGILRQRRLLGVAIGSLLRYLTHVYSLSYNASYLVVEAILVGITIHLLGKRREIFEPDQG